jgi:hypothetical protein
MFRITNFKASFELLTLYFLESKACFGRLNPALRFNGMDSYTA